jgi:hypothetical protein
MSELAFDKDGEPIEVHEDTECWRVRVFQNPGARGTCATARDEQGAPIYIGRDATFLELKRAVGGEPGLYRLDQCDGARAPVAGAAPAYVLLTENQRNGGVAGGGAGNEPLLAVVMELVREFGNAHRVAVREQANMMRSVADIVRACDGAGISRRAPLPPVPAPDVDPDDDDDADDTDDEQPPPKHITQTIVERLLPKLEIALGQYIAKRMKADATPPPTTTPNPAPTLYAAPAAATSAPGAPAGVVVGVSAVDAAASSVTAMTPVAPTLAATTSPASGAPMATDAVATTTRMAPPASATEPVPPRNATSTITPAQIDHLLAIRARLSPREQAIGDLVRERMSLEQQQQWLTELCAMSVDDALAMVRSMIPKPRKTRPTDTAANENRATPPALDESPKEKT